MANKRKEKLEKEGKSEIRLIVLSEHEKYVRAFANKLLVGELEPGQTIRIE